MQGVTNQNNNVVIERETTKAEAVRLMAALTGLKPNAVKEVYRFRVAYNGRLSDNDERIGTPSYVILFGDESGATPAERELEEKIQEAAGGEFGINAQTHFWADWQRFAAHLPDA